MPRPISRAGDHLEDSPVDDSDNPALWGWQRSLVGGDYGFSEVRDPSGPPPAEEPMGPRTQGAEEDDISFVVGGGSEPGGRDFVPTELVDFDPNDIAIYGAWDETRGYVVPGDSMSVLMSNGIPRHVAQEHVERGFRPVSPDDARKEAFRKMLASMSPAERDAYLRFSDL